MNIALKAGEYLWRQSGTHAVDDKGFAIVLTEDQEVEMDDDVAEHALAVIKADRQFRGLDPETGLPLPEPEVVPEETPVTEEGTHA